MQMYITLEIRRIGNVVPKELHIFYEMWITYREMGT